MMECVWGLPFFPSFFCLFLLGFYQQEIRVCALGAQEYVRASSPGSTSLEPNFVVPPAPQLDACVTFDVECVKRQALLLQKWGVGVRRWLHQHPEVKYQEHNTSKYISKVLQGLGIRYSAGWGAWESDPTPGDAKAACKGSEIESIFHFKGRGTGIVAELGTGQRPAVALRADIDALPILEKAKVPFASKHHGRMHACGHDVHTTMLLMASAILKANQAHIQGTVRLIFQPAEEGGKGALMMRKENVLKVFPPVQSIFGLHVFPKLATGSLATKYGPFFAGVAEFEIEILGAGGHAAMPAETRDPIPAAAAVVQSIYARFARSGGNPLKIGSMVSVTQVSAGTAFNVIPSNALIRGTIRFFANEGLAEWAKIIEHVSKSVAFAYGCDAKYTVDMLVPAVINDHSAVDTLMDVAEISNSSPVTIQGPFFYAEDFAYFQEEVPGTFAAIGVGDGTLVADDEGKQNAVRTDYPLHHDMFAADERVLHKGAAIHVLYSIESMRKLTQNSNKSDKGTTENEDSKRNEL